jgi:hypothetical protein
MLESNLAAPYGVVPRTRTPFTFPVLLYILVLSESLISQFVALGVVSKCSQLSTCAYLCIYMCLSVYLLACTLKQHCDLL